MKLAKWLSMALAAAALALLASLMATRALAPKPGCAPASVVEPFASSLLSGTVTGLDPGDSIRLLLEAPVQGQAGNPGRIIQHFDAVNGRWQQVGLSLPPGHYRVLPEVEGYVHVPHSITIQVPDNGMVWRYQTLDFRFLRRTDAVALLGLPLCPDPSSPMVPATAVPQGLPSATNEPGLEPAPSDGPEGLCYANHLADVRLVPAGLQGRLSGLPDDQMATISLYALPPVAEEQYSQGEPPPADSGLTCPPEVSALVAVPPVAAEWPLAAALRAGNGIWGLVDPSLVGHKYRVVAHAAGQAAEPPAYDVVVFAGKAPGFPSSIDFAFAPESAELAPPAGEADLSELVEGNTALALDLYQTLRSGGANNLVYSPYSLSLALGMAYAGARGETERQMGGALHFSLPQEQVHPAFNRLARELDNRSADPGSDDLTFRLNTANALWVQEDYRLLHGFLDILTDSYGTGIRRVDFREAEARPATNDWTSHMTGGRIEELIPPCVLDASTGLALTNAAHFRAAWAIPFESQRTRQRVIYLLDGGVVTAPMMNQGAVLANSEGSGYQAVQLVYQCNEMAMVILLPAHGGFEAFERSLDAERLEAVLAGLAERQVALAMPRYEFESGYELGAVLASMGMTLAFTHQADLSGMTPDQELYVGDVLHEAAISVDEAGTEMAATSAVVLPLTGGPLDATSVTVDRPFLFLVRDLQAETILFLGRVVDPRGSIGS